MAKTLHSSTIFIPDALKIGPQRRIWMDKQKERERISQIIRKEQRKIAEEERKRKEKGNATLNKSNAPDLINSKTNAPISHSPLALVPAEKRENKRQEKGKDHVTDCYPPSPVYMANYEENASTLLNNLIPKPTPEAKKDTNKIEDNKAA